MKIAVIGAAGVVGGAVSDGLERLGHEVFRCDPKLNTTIPQVVDFNPSIVFVCVPTPLDNSNRCDVSIVEEVVGELVLAHYNGIIAIKSTVTPGTTERLYKKFTSAHYGPRLAFVPEFLRERSAFYDFTEGHDTLVVGTLSRGATHEDRKIYDCIVAAHGKYPNVTRHLKAVEAEVVKYYSNCFNALRITFANAVYDVCEKLGARYTAVKNAFVSRGTATDMYLDVNDNFRGFGGVCLNKDPAAFAQLAKDLGLNAKILQVIVDDNKLYEVKVPPGMREK